MGAPSVLELAEPGQIAIHAAIDADEVWDLLPPLKAAGAIVDPRRARREARAVRRAGLAEALPRAAEIVADVRDRGDEALLDWTRAARRRAAGRAARAGGGARGGRARPGGARRARARLAEAVRAFHEPQRPPDTTVEAVARRRARAPLPAARLGRDLRARRAAPLPSSLVMAAVPASVAGVARIAVVSPRPRAALLATARELGLDEVYAVGGAQAIAALAYGTETIRAGRQDRRPRQLAG